MSAASVAYSRSEGKTVEEMTKAVFRASVMGGITLCSVSLLRWVCWYWCTVLSRIARPIFSVDCTSMRIEAVVNQPDLCGFEVLVLVMCHTMLACAVRWVGTTDTQCRGGRMLNLLSPSRCCSAWSCTIAAKELSNTPSAGAKAKVPIERAMNGQGSECLSRHGHELHMQWAMMAFVTGEMRGGGRDPLVCNLLLRQAEKHRMRFTRRQNQKRVRADHECIPPALVGIAASRNRSKTLGTVLLVLFALRGAASLGNLALATYNPNSCAAWTLTKVRPRPGWAVLAVAGEFITQKTNGLY